MELVGQLNIRDVPSLRNKDNLRATCLLCKLSRFFRLQSLVNRPAKIGSSRLFSEVQAADRPRSMRHRSHSSDFNFSARAGFANNASDDRKTLYGTSNP
ncbi:hypothetical protein DPV78_009652 [Talaromyces pinophilus]|nr:hypothetical protein DPV78_009652 [Talaromyces pinophilus]